MANIYIMRLICPKRHCIAGLAYDPDKYAEAQVKNFIKWGLERTNFSPWCAACGSKNLNYETQATEFKTLAEATPSIIAEAERYARERRFYANLRRTARNN